MRSQYWEWGRDRRGGKAHSLIRQDAGQHQLGSTLHNDSQRLIVRLGALHLVEHQLGQLVGLEQRRSGVVSTR